MHLLVAELAEFGGNQGLEDGQDSFPVGNDDFQRLAVPGVMAQHVFPPGDNIRRNVNVLAKAVHGMSA